MYMLRNIQLRQDRLAIILYIYEGTLPRKIYTKILMKIKRGKGASGQWLCSCSLLYYPNNFDIGFKKTGGNSHLVKLWTDRWIGEYSLSILFPNLFCSCNWFWYFRIIYVATMVGSNLGNLTFTRQLTRVLREEWGLLVEQIRIIHLDSNQVDTFELEMECKRV